MLESTPSLAEVPCGLAASNPSHYRAFRVVSFFSGCGGLDLGFDGGFTFLGKQFPKLPFHLLRAYEIDATCKKTYELNLKTPFEVADLSKANVDQMPAADVLIGGFPCQEYSTCGPQGGALSSRGSLYKAMSRYARRWKPAVVIAENVPNLERINNGADFIKILRSFANAGYRCVKWNVYAPDYGVPQARNRVVLVFIRNDLRNDPSLPSKLIGDVPTVEWAIGDLINVVDDEVPNQSQYFKAALAKRGHGQGDEISPRDEPGYTVRANARSRIQFHYELPRRLTVRECARLQSFPDTFVFPHTATRNIYQIGNAVPPVLAHAIATQIHAYLAGIKFVSTSE